MPPRLALTAEAYVVRLREQTRLRVQRYRHNVTLRRNVTPAPREGDGNVSPPQTPPVRESLHLEEIEDVLSALSDRGYVHNPRFWQLAAQQYPVLCLEFEVLLMRDWLLQPANRKRRCSQAFLRNWLRRAADDRLARREMVAPVAATPPPRPAPRRQVEEEPPLFPKGHDLERIPTKELYAVMAAGASVPLADKLAAIRNGQHRGGAL